MMKKLMTCLVGALSALATIEFAAASETAAVTIVATAQAGRPERLAADELAKYLGGIFPQTKFTVASERPAAGPMIVVGSIAGDPSLRELVGGDVSKPESFVVRKVNQGGRDIGVIAGADSRGTLFGVYALLEKLGCGFYISGDAMPPPRAFTFDGWDMADAPLVSDRMVFDWHNFLSGCSTWNLAEWQSWTRQAQKQRFSAIMVHAYGNNPMVSFTYNGKTKPVGYLSTTVRGRDWSTMHVNDVRQLFGGEVFNSPVFGADAAQGPEEQRAEAARKLMQGVFAYAGERAMDVFFADDVDTISANPQELIATLPQSARFTTDGGKIWLANPDTPEGYAYYKAQVAALLADYPQITTLVVWFRNGGTPWMDVKLSELPPEWQTEFNAAVARKPEAAKYWHAHNLFALGKITRAFERALKELGQERVKLATGSWHFTFFPAGDMFMPPQVKFIGLDYGVLHDDSGLATAEKLQRLAEVGAHRAIIPVIWAHHDDGNYIGRSYTPFSDFNSKLADARAAGFGIIHWTTRPLDLYFKSHAEQVWSSTKDRPLAATCADMAERMFGAGQRETMAAYLNRWITDAPKFARETSDRFIDRQLTNVTEVVAGCSERLKLIAAADESKMTPEQREHLNYFKGLEEFIAAFFQNHDFFQQAQALQKSGNIAGARAALAQCHPESVIGQFAKFSSIGGITRGEQGLVVSMNTRWLPHIARLRQQLGMDSVRYNFGPTSHDPLAQAAGKFTFHFDANHRLWQTLGAEETEAESFVVPDSAPVADEICRSGIESAGPLTLTLRPIAGHRTDGAVLPAGNYRVRLLMLDPVSTAAGQRVFGVKVAGSGDASISSYAFDPERAHFLRVVCRGNAKNDWNSIEEISVDSIAKAASEPLATASHEMKDYPATAAVDGKRETRWATRGLDEWIQLRLDPSTPASRIGIAWFGGAARQPKFEIQLSDDGQQWRAVKNLRADDAAATATEMLVDVFAEAGSRGRALERSLPVLLAHPANVTVTLTPAVGKAILFGAVLEPASP